MTTSVLDREMYTEAGAARLLGVASATLHYWLEGGQQGGKRHDPVIRENRTDARAVTWAEFVEAGLLRQYRKDHKIPMVELRSFIVALREKLNVPYPLAHSKPFVSGRKLLLEVQSAAGLDAEFALVAEVGSQYILAPAAKEFYERVTWRNDIAAQWKPAGDLNSPVIIDPDVRGGRPSVGGISTEILWEQIDGGEDEDDLARTFGLTVGEVQWAMSYELAARAA